MYPTRRDALLEFLHRLETDPSPYHLRAHRCLGECVAAYCPCCSEECGCAPLTVEWWAARLLELQPDQQANGDDYRDRPPPRGRLGRVVVSTDPTVRAEEMRKRFVARVGLFDGGLKVSAAFAFAIVGLGNCRNGAKDKVMIREKREECRRERVRTGDRRDAGGDGGTGDAGGTGEANQHGTRAG